MPKKLTTGAWVAKAREINGDRYDYSPTEYKNCRTPVCILCHEKDENGIEHGEFWQIPNNHIHHKQGCPICGENTRREKRSNGLEHFLSVCRSIYGNKFDYSNVDKYVNNKQRITIICPIHGPFERRIYDHTILRRGCPICDNLSLKGLVCGVGVNDLYKSDNMWEYSQWCYMIHRCYYRGVQETKPTYRDCYVCDEWLIASNFAEWARNPQNGYRGGYHLDKDILVKGNKVYSPDTCCFVPPRINGLLIKRQNDRGAFPIGVTKNNNGFSASINKRKKNVHIGTYPTPEEAFQAYKTAKEAYIKKVAQEYYDRGEITKKVYNALMRYEVEITD